MAFAPNTIIRRKASNIMALAPVIMKITPNKVRTEYDEASTENNEKKDTEYNEGSTRYNGEIIIIIIIIMMMMMMMMMMIMMMMIMIIITISTNIMS